MIPLRTFLSSMPSHGFSIMIHSRIWRLTTSSESELTKIRWKTFWSTLWICTAYPCTFLHSETQFFVNQCKRSFASSQLLKTSTTGQHWHSLFKSRLSGYSILPNSQMKPNMTKLPAISRTPLLRRSKSLKPNLNMLSLKSTMSRTGEILTIFW